MPTVGARSLEFQDSRTGASNGAEPGLIVHGTPRDHVCIAPDMRQLADNLWIKRYPLSVLGTDHGRMLTILRLPSGKVIVHSMAPFSAADLAEIRWASRCGWSKR